MYNNYNIISKEIILYEKISRKYKTKFVLYMYNVFNCIICSYRMPDLFPDADAVRKLQEELDKIIEEGIEKIAKLFKKPKAGMQLCYLLFLKLKIK